MQKIVLIGRAFLDMYMHSYFGCVEVQQRGALHFHILVWGGIPPSILETGSFLPQLSETISHVLNSMFCAEMPSEYHLQDLVLRAMKHTRTGIQHYPKSKLCHASMKHIPLYSASTENWNHHLYTSLQRTGIHEHTFTCKKPPQGAERCRGAKPSALCNKTQPIFLEYEENKFSNKKEIIETMPQPLPLPPYQKYLIKSNRELRDYSKEPFIDLSQATLQAWELKRSQLKNLPEVPQLINYEIDSSETIPNSDEVKLLCINNVINNLPTHQLETQANTDIESWLHLQNPSFIFSLYKNLRNSLQDRNGYVVETNDLLQIASGSSTNAILLGASEQSRCALYYVAPYVSSKNKVAVEASLLALRAAHEHVNQYPSTASNSGTEIRTVQHIFTRVLNTLSRAVEVSDTQIALTLLNVPSLISSDTYIYFTPQYSINYFNDQFQPEKINPNTNYGPAAIFTIRNNEESLLSDEDEIQKVPVHSPVHWWHRGEALRNMTIFEYTALIDILPISLTSDLEDSSDVPTTGRKKRNQFLFTSKHPLHNTHAQFLRAKHKTVIFCWKSQRPHLPDKYPTQPPTDSPPYMQSKYQEALTDWQKHADALAEFCSTIFLPHPNTYKRNTSESTNIHFGPDASFGSDYESDDMSHSDKEFFGEHYFGNNDQLNQDLPTIWDKFCQRIKELETSHFLIDHMRLQAMTTYLTASESNQTKRILLSNWRHRNTTVWSEQEKQEADTLFTSVGLGKRCAQACDNDLDQYITTRDYNSLLIKSSMEESQFRSVQIEAIKQYCPENVYAKHPTRAHLNYPTDDFVYCTDQLLQKAYSSTAYQKVLDPQKIADKIKDAKCPREETAIIFDPSNNIPSNAHSHQLQLLTTIQKTREYIEQRQLNPGQLTVVMELFLWFQAFAQNLLTSSTRKEALQRLFSVPQTKPPNMLVTGEPGAGKSFCIDSICHIINMLGIGIPICTSFNGIAAVNIDGGTVCKTFDINPNNCQKITLDPDKLTALRNKLCCETISCIILDEVSTIDVVTIALIDYRLRQTMQIDLPFAALPVLFTGDFNQLGAVKKTQIPTAMMHYAMQQRNLLHNIPNSSRKKSRTFSNKLSYEGCQRLSCFSHYHLKDQQRSTDPIHTHLIKRLSKGLPINIRDILNIKPLTLDDLKHDFAGWAFAPILISTNAERLDIIRYKAIMFALYYNTYVLKWPTKISKFINRPSDEELPDLLNSNAFFWQYFVPGAPAYLDSNINIDLGLVNGAVITLHSLTFDNAEDQKKVFELCNNENVDHGSEIIIPLPAAVNVLVHTIDNHHDELSPQRKKQIKVLNEFSKQMGINRITAKEVIIPLHQSINSSKEPIRYIFPNGNIHSSLSEVYIKQPFPFDLAFAMTVHKAQGRTIPRVIVDIKQHPVQTASMVYAAVFVALSRVKEREHLRLLEPSSSFPARSSLYEWLAQLKPNSDIFPFLHGFLPSQHWDFSRSLQFHSSLRPTDDVFHSTSLAS